MSSHRSSPTGARPTHPSPPPARVELRAHIWTAWFGLALVLVTATRTDPDLWGHVRFGLDWLQTLRLPAVDPYSFTQDRPWVNHEWMSEAVMGAAFALGGGAGLVALKVLLVGAALSVVAWRLRPTAPLGAVFVLSIALAGALPVTATVRPQLWSLLGLTLLMPLLTAKPPTGRHVALGALLFGLWANAHGGWITGGATLGLHAAIRIANRPSQAPRWLMLGAASLAATLVNPYGEGLWTFLASTVRTSRPDVSEWLPFGLQEPPIMWVSIVAPLLTLGLLAMRRRTRPPLEVCAVVLLLVAAGLRVSRVAPLINIPVFALLGPWVSHAAGRRGQVTVSDRGAALVLLVPPVLLLLAAAAPVGEAFRCLRISDTWAPDRLAAARLVGARGRLWSTFDWGQYAIWHFGPELQVSIDGRRETVYSPDIIEWHRAVEAGQPAALQRLASAAPDYVWMRNRHDAARQWLDTHGWQTVVATPDSFIAARAGAPVLPQGTPALPPCFP